MSSFEEQLVEHRVYLIRFARLQLRNDDWAEDAVSETLLAALSKPQSFDNRSQLKTWLVGILKHKVIDLLRSNARLVALPDAHTEGEGDELDRLAFQSDGHFVGNTQRLGRPRQDTAAGAILSDTGRLPGAAAASAGPAFFNARVAGAFDARSL
jgi:RNA polymerase sigma factor (sigma-70 family)